MKSLLEAVSASKWVSVASVVAERRDLRLGLELWPALSGRPPEPWAVSCFGVREFSLGDFDGGGLAWWPDNHPVLSQYTSPKASLQIRLASRTLETVIGILLVAHTEAVDDWIDFDRFISVPAFFREMEKPATFAGPEFLLSAYAAALARAQIAVKLKRHKRKLYWYGRGWSERRYDLSLLHFGDSFIAAERFTAHPDVILYERV
jgi:hypothetical protein